MATSHRAERTETEDRVRELRGRVKLLREAVGRQFLGHAEVVDLLTIAILAGGHVLLEGAPGLGKTTLVRALAGALDLEFGRIQFTPDLMPADILGGRILEERASGERAFAFHPGPIFTHVLLADEINRATPRTQAALLEAMEERQVTTYGETRALEPPFAVIATQNPIEMEGTYPLPEAQVDRFLAKLELGAPTEGELVEILAAGSTARGPDPAGPALSRAEVIELQGLAAMVPVSSEMVELTARVVLATAPDSDSAPEVVRRSLRWGASPRGGRAVLAMARARALLRGRLHVTREDVDSVALPALRHRLIFSYEGEASGIHADQLLGAVLESVGRGGAS